MALGWSAARRFRASPVPSASPVWRWPMGGTWPPTSSWWASVRSPNVEWLNGGGLRTGRRRGVRWRRRRRRSRTSSRWGTAPPGTSPRVGGAHRVEHWTGACERAAVAVSTLLAGRLSGAPVKAPYFWSDQYGQPGSSSRASRARRTRSPSKSGDLDARQLPGRSIAATAVRSRYWASTNHACSPG